MEGTPSAQTIVQRRYSPRGNDSIVIYELVGALQFAEAEMLLRIVQDEPVASNTIVFDLNNLSFVHDVGRRMLIEGLDRLIQDGHSVAVIDPDQLLKNQTTHRGIDLPKFNHLDEYLTSLQ